MKQKNFLKIALLFFMAIITNNSFSQIFITEIADPNDNAGARYVEIFNQGSNPVDLSSWALRRWTNDNASPQSDVSLSGTIAAKGFIIFAANSSNFNTAFPSFSGTVVQLGSGGPVDSNGDDNIALIDNNGTLVDMFGVAGEDGSGTCHEFEGGRAERKSTVLTAKATWNEADWNVWADSTVSGCTSHTNDSQNVADGFDPGSWVGAAATPGITIGAVSNSTSEDATTATFTVVLQTQPTNDVVLNITSGDTSEITINAPTSLTFTNGNWDQTQTVTVTGVNDALQDGNVDVTITISVDDANSDDDYDPVADVTTTITNEDNEAALLIINEILADPDATTGDANGDGTVSTQDDEFVEIYNNSGAALDISGYKLNDGFGEKHVFTKGTIIPKGGTIVVFGGGTPTNIAGLVQVASSGLGLNNGGDTVTIFNASDVTIASETFGGDAGNNQSIAREPDFTGAFVEHSTIATNAIQFSPGKDNTDNIPFIKTWTGATDNNWATATNWLESSIPSASTDNVIIHSGLTNYPTISSGTGVNVNSVLVESGASLIADGTSTLTSDLTIKRALETNNWYLLGMPVNGESISDMIANNDFDNTNGTGSNIGLSFYDNDQVSNQWTYASAASTGSFSETGYSAKLNNAGTITAIGSLRTTNVNVSVTNGTATGFNLIGNIYASYLAANSNADGTNNLLSVNSGKLTETTLWLWNQSTDSYDEVNLATTAHYIAPSQGFFVQVSSNQNFSFTEAMQAHQSTDSFQKSASSRPEIKLFLNDGTLNRNTEVYYIDETTTDFDNGYDSSIFGGTSHEFAIFTELLSKNISKKLGIQSLPNSNHENMVIPIGINAKSGKEISFTAEVLNLPNGLKVYLEDRLTKTFTRLGEENSEYKITVSDALNGVGRFYLHTTQSVLNIDDAKFLNSVSIFKTNNANLRIAGLPEGKASISLFNILGKKVLSTSFKSNTVNNIRLPRLTTGVYFVNLMTEKGKITQKNILE